MLPSDPRLPLLLDRQLVEQSDLLLDIHPRMEVQLVGPLHGRERDG